MMIENHLPYNFFLIGLTMKIDQFSYLKFLDNYPKIKTKFVNFLIKKSKF